MYFFYPFYSFFFLIILLCSCGKAAYQVEPNREGQVAVNNHGKDYFPLGILPDGPLVEVMGKIRMDDLRNMRMVSRRNYKWANDAIKRYFSPKHLYKIYRDRDSQEAIKARIDFIKKIGIEHIFYEGPFYPYIDTLVKLLQEKEYPLKTFVFHGWGLNGDRADLSQSDQATKLNLTQKINLLSKLDQVTTLSLSSLGGKFKPIEGKDIQTLAENLPKKLRILDLSGNRIGVVGAQVVAAMTQLEELYLSSNRIGDEVICALAKGLPRLRVLHVGNNDIGVVAAQALATMTELEELYLNYSDIGDEGIRALAKGVPRLRVLNVDWNDIGVVGAQALATMTQLEKLYISGNPIRPEGAQVLLEKLLNLKRIDISYCRLTTEMKQRLLKEANARGICMTVDESEPERCCGII